MAQNQSIQSESFLLTECAEHGSRSCRWDDARHYFLLVEEWRGVTHDDPTTSPWWCCDRMVLDPFGVFDH